jgi:uncharacterized membrane protein
MEKPMRYVVPLVILSLTLLLFFLPRLFANSAYRDFGWLQAGLRILVALPLLLSGVVLHFLRTAETVRMIPPGFPAPALLVTISGVLEIAGAVGLFLPQVRKFSGLLVAVMMIAIFPANVYVAGATVGGLTMPSVPVRTAMQVVYILLVLTASFGLPGIAPRKTATSVMESDFSTEEKG